MLFFLRVSVIGGYPRYTIRTVVSTNGYYLHDAVLAGNFVEVVKEVL